MPRASKDSGDFSYRVQKSHKVPEFSLTESLRGFHRFTLKEEVKNLGRAPQISTEDSIKHTSKPQKGRKTNYKKTSVTLFGNNNNIRVY